MSTYTPSENEILNAQPESVKNLKLGSNHAAHLQATKDGMYDLYKQDLINKSNIATAETIAKDALTIAQNKNKVVNFDNIDDMIAKLNAMTSKDYVTEDIQNLRSGDIINIVEPEQYDFWVVEVKDTKVTNTKQTLIDKDYLATQFGYIVVSRSDKKIDLSNYYTKDEVNAKLETAGTVQTVTVNGKSALVDSDAKIRIKVGKQDATVTQDASEGVIVTIPESSSSGEAEPLESTLTEVLNSELVSYKYENVDYKAIKLEASIVVTGIYNSKKELIITQPVVVTENKVDYIYYLVAIDGAEEAGYHYQTIEGNVVGGGGSADTAELEAKIETVENYLKMPFSITLEKTSLTGKPQAGGYYYDTDLIVDGVIDKINGIEINENSTIIYEEDVSLLNIVTNPSGEIVSVNAPKIYIKAYYDKNSQKTVIQRSFNALFLHNNNSYTINLPKITLSATPNSLVGSLSNYLKDITLYNHFVELAVPNLQYTFSGKQRTAVARLYLNYIDNINTSTLDISEWIKSPFIKDKTGQIHGGDNSTATSCAGRIITGADIIPFGIIEAYKIYFENNNYKIAVNGLVSSINADEVTVEGNELLSETTIIKHSVVPIKVF